MTIDFYIAGRHWEPAECRIASVIPADSILENIVASTPRWKLCLVLGTFTAVFIALAVISYRGESATWDEPQHLTAGFVAWTERDYRIDIEHPPLIRLWTALP